MCVVQGVITSLCGPVIACAEAIASQEVQSYRDFRGRPRKVSTSTGVVPLLWNRDPWFPSRVLLRGLLRQLLWELLPLQYLRRRLLK